MCALALEGTERLGIKRSGSDWMWMWRCGQGGWWSTRTAGRLFGWKRGNKKRKKRKKRKNNNCVCWSLTRGDDVYQSNQNHDWFT